MASTADLDDTQPDALEVQTSQTLFERRRRDAPRLHTRVSLTAQPPHSRTRSISSPFTPSFSHPTSLVPAPSPTTVAFPTSPSSPQLTPSTLPNSFRHPPSLRHTRVHSRNLSVFFPRPESHSTIQEHNSEHLDEPAQENTVPDSPIPAAGSSVNLSAGQLSASFRFGSRPPPNDAPPTPSASQTSIQGPSRRGHHHKHSLSHNFFSFLEPGSQNLNPAHLHTQPTPVPVSPWAPISPFPVSAAPDKQSFSPIEHHPTHTHTHTHAAHGTHTHRHSHPKSIARPPGATAASYLPLACALGQCILGGWLWVVGQHASSLACTGLGYWVVFDAAGVVLAAILPQHLRARERDQKKTPTRQFYGTARVRTVCMFAQAVYLMFASVYMSKEAIEHTLLHAGHTGTHVHTSGNHPSADGHHHHVTDPGRVGLEFPFVLISLGLFSMLGNAFAFKNHSDLADVASDRLRSLTSLIRSPSRSYLHLTDDGALENVLADILSNPFIVAPVSFGLAIMGMAHFLHTGYHRVFDLILACLQAIVTFRLAYRACVVLGTVLLQTSPPRGSSDGRMEAFLRAMKEIERHPKVLHLPAPHIWQVTPANRHSSSLSSLSSQAGGGDAVKRDDSPGLVVTLELHVHAELEDDEVLKLTRWTWEKCVTALGAATRVDGSVREVGGIDVSVGVVRG